MLSGMGSSGVPQLHRLPSLDPLVKGRVAPSSREGASEDVSFDDMLGGAIARVDHLLDRADRVTQDLALGKDVALHDVTIATEQAQLALQFTIAVRNKLVEAYQQVMRMQV